MPDAPWISTFIAIGLIPVAFLFVHAFLSGLKGWRFHKITGLAAIVWDLSMSIGYMLFRTFGGEVEGSTLVIEGAILAYFIIHGTMAVIVIALEFAVLFTGWANWKEKPVGEWHKKLSRILFVLWWAAFLTGELFYLVYYVL
ncbi:MAG: DUF420 domain-containing protein [Thermoplasmata archaeon]|nr:MAG: DUF420 domain-containing protein [Thermoplasmata archaeon]